MILVRNLAVTFFCYLFITTAFSKAFVLSNIKDPVLANLMVRTLYIDDKKRIYIGTDSGLYRYANNDLVKLNDKYALTAKSLNGPISSILPLNNRYLAINVFPENILYFDQLNDGFVSPPYNLFSTGRIKKSQQISENRWLWLTYQGLYVYNAKTDTSAKLINSGHYTNKNHISNFIYNENSKSLYISNNQGILFTPDLTLQPKVIYDNEPSYIYLLTEIKGITHIFTSKGLELWFNNQNKLIKQQKLSFCSPQQFKRIQKLDANTIYQDTQLFKLSSNTIFAVSECGIYSYDVSKQKITKIIEPNLSNTLQWLKGTSYPFDSLISSRLIHTQAGLFLLDNTLGLVPLKNSSNASQGGTSYSAMKIDDDQIVIADGTPGLKIASTRINNFHNLNNSDLERLTGGNSFRHVVKTDDQTLWLSSQTNGLIKLIFKNGQWYKEKHFLLKTHVRSLFFDKSNLWVATEGAGLHLVNLKTNSIKKLPSPGDQYGLLNFLLLKNEQLLISATDGLYVYNRKNQQLIKQISSIHGNIWGMAQTKDENIWIGSHSMGLVKLNSKFQIQEQYPHDDLYKSAIMDMTLDDDDQPVIATWGGGLLYRKQGMKAFSQLSSKDGLNNDTIQSVVKTDSHTYWLGTENGLTKINLCQSNSCQTKIKNYTTNNGLSTNLFDVNSANLNPDGSLIFSGFFGVTWFDPKKDIVKNEQAPKHHFINRLIINGENAINKLSTYKGENFLELPHNTEHIKIIFNSDDYIDQGDKQYRYKINNGDWNFNNTPEINLSALSYGKYSIVAGSSNSDGIWTKNNLTLQLTITPPFWLSNYAFIAYFILLLSFIILFIRYRNLKLVKLNKTLERIVQERTEELNQAIISKEKILETNSHELQTPLTLILNYIHLLSQTSIQGKTRDYVELIEKQAKRLKLLVKNMLKHTEDQFFSEKTIAVDIQRSLKTIVEHLNIQAAQKNISIRLHNHINKETIINMVEYSDSKIFQNIIDNAIKYSPNNSIINIKLSILNDNFIFKITDQGIGFKNLNKLGSKFYREAVQVDGTGLGLTIVQEYVNKNNGTIIFQNNKGDGCNITVSLPLIKEERPFTYPVLKETKSVDATDINLVNDDEHILVVEDNKDLCNLFKDTIANRFNIIFCNNGKDALEHLAKNINYLPELIISDVMMPKLSGFELCSKLKNSTDFKHIPLLLLTAKTDSYSQKKGLSFGADDYINKPFTVANLEQKIVNILTTNKARKERWLKYISSHTNIFSDRNPSAPENEFVQRIKIQIDNNWDNINYSVTELAQTLHMSVSTLNRKLKQYFGHNFTEILKAARLNNACNLLKGSDKIQIVAEKCGYNSHSYFNKHFKAKFGISPNEYRKKFQSKHQSITDQEEILN